MPQAGRHYERAVERYLRARRVPFVGVEHARSLLGIPQDARAARDTLKSFDCVLYGSDRHLLLEIKGRRVAPRTPRATTLAPSTGEVTTGDATPSARLECWATRADVESLLRWQVLFGEPFEAALLFAYWCDGEPPSLLSHEVFACEHRWYALRLITAADYASVMRTRSPRWGTVDLAPADFTRLSRPLLPQQPFALPHMASVDVGRGVLGSEIHSHLTPAHAPLAVGSLPGPIL